MRDDVRDAAGGLTPSPAPLPPSATAAQYPGAGPRQTGAGPRQTGGRTGGPTGNRDEGRSASGTPIEPVELVLFDRDGTLVHDVPYNGDPAKVRPIGDAVDAVARLRATGLRTGVVTNQSGIAKGLISAADELAVRQRVVDLFGPFDTWQVCPHDVGDGCGCRKPAPGMVLAACAATGVPPARAVVIGDIGADLGAAGAAGARAVLVPTEATRGAEIEAAAARAATLTEAAEIVLGWARPAPSGSTTGDDTASTPRSGGPRTDDPRSSAPHAGDPCTGDPDSSDPRTAIGSARAARS